MARVMSARTTANRFCDTRLRPPYRRCQHRRAVGKQKGPGARPRPRSGFFFGKNALTSDGALVARLHWGSAPILRLAESKGASALSNVGVVDRAIRATTPNVQRPPTRSTPARAPCWWRFATREHETLFPSL